MRLDQRLLAALSMAAIGGFTALPAHVASSISPAFDAPILACQEAPPAFEMWNERALGLPAPSANQPLIVPAANLEFHGGIPTLSDAGAEKADIAMALRVLAAEARAVQAGQIPRHQMGERVNSEPLRALLVSLRAAAHPAVTARMTDEQKKLAAALAVMLLGDSRAVSDSTAFDGPLMCVRHLATPILDSLAGASRGHLYSPGGLTPPGWAEQQIARSREIVDEWQTWWTIAAEKSPREWQLSFAEDAAGDWKSKALALPAPTGNPPLVVRDRNLRVDAEVTRLADFHLETADIAMALRVLAAEARLVRAGEIPGHAQGEHVDAEPLRPLILSLLVAAHPNAKARMTAEQKKLAAALAVMLLDDFRVLADASAACGPITEVKHKAVRILESLAGGTRGPLFQSGGDRDWQAAERARRRSEKIVAAWREWWKTAAGESPADWRLGADAIVPDEPLDDAENTQPLLPRPNENPQESPRENGD